MNANEIIGFPEPRFGRRGDDRSETPTAPIHLVDGLQRVRGAEIARIADLAGRVSQRFGAIIAVGFLYFEILGRPPDNTDSARQADRLRRVPSAAPLIIEELLALADSAPGLADRAPRSTSKV